MTYELKYDNTALTMEDGKSYPWHLRVYIGEKPYCIHIGNYETFEQAKKFLKQYEKILR